jgi:membrane protease subunit (stomatin/prohibitin family)
MGFLEKLRAELVDIIEWVDDDRQTLVWRFPRYHNQIKNGARLIVRPGQVAILVHQGRLADQFTPGTHSLETKNLPVLSTLAGWAHGFDSPFKAEIHFVATHQITDLKWGTANPVLLRDPEIGPLRVRAFGTYTLRATDPARLLKELVGSGTNYEAGEIGELLRAIIASEFADLVADAEIPVLDLASHYQSLSEKLRSAVVSRIRGEFGLDLPQLILVNVSVPEEVERALDAKSSMSLLGDLARYQQYQVGQSTPIAAANPAGGIAGAGLGLGMGLAVATQMTSVATASPPALWHYEERGRAAGPFSASQISEAIAAGRLVATTLAWTSGMPAWKEISQISSFAHLFSSTPPPLPR